MKEKAVHRSRDSMRKTIMKEKRKMRMKRMKSVN
jgi:hypothetical protein